MTLKETNESMESKIQEIERIVAEVVDSDVCSKYLSCSECPLHSGHPDKYLIRRWICYDIVQK